MAFLLKLPRLRLVDAACPLGFRDVDHANQVSPRIIVCRLIIVLGLQHFASSQSVVQTSRKAHRHIMMGKSIPADVAPEFAMAETSLEAGAKKENPITNQSRTYDAFTVSGARLFVKERKTGKI